MNAVANTVARATLDATGRLVSADPSIADLHERAGGCPGEVLAVPALASAARTARRMGVIVARPATVADEEIELDLWVRAQPVGDEVRLTVTGWRRQRPWPTPQETKLVVQAADPDAIRWSADATMRTTHVGLGEAKRHGIAAETWLGQSLGRWLAGEALERVARGETIRAARVTVGGNGRGAGREALLDAVVRHDATGALAGVDGVIVPIVDRGGADAVAGEFTRGLDHALRRPLARIVANADSIQACTEGPIETAYADYASDIAGAGRHLLALIDDLVDLQAIERADFRVDVEPIDLADLARRAAGLLSVRADEAGVVIQRPGPADAVSATGEYRRVLQILVNLVGNAVRYAPGGSAVTVAAMRGPDGRANVVVADRGKGIAAEDAARVFEKFERVDPGEPGGSGLGLYIARRLARAMGGDLTLESAAGAGARFTLTLPTR